MMSNFSHNIAPYVKREMLRSYKVQKKGDPAMEFRFLENAHVLGQESTYWHVKTHYLMLRWAIRQGDIKEISGQCIRIIGAALLTAIDGVPIGNTGGSNVHSLKVMPISAEHAEIILKTKSLSR
ncbi:DUF3703 domain-containing protein [Photobacterium carnosum]|uniref:DUF3703 domain-containing protein n=2 Tax=Photobacterium carnosum TaxID=2023717 RepID=A0A2N4UN79_9GAMM|nr:hypothetical protein CIT27_08995 [Photobacterium carnosum]MBY3789519.1 DUF3703 domain-containing protein [Photobacterium carnosum]MCD9495543.1 DUF3703 domain-containing protein [Photobacterium carnosum]MCD9497020.1 DUF3703 domain-containing protein [Photobacterium carnosum]MCD9513989.1 DUF3703 domain-containing protein [Photobacterium carnosum]